MTAFKFPKTIGACADRLYQLRQKRLEQQKLVAAIEEEEKALKEHIIQTLPKSEATGASGKVANVKVVPKTVPQVKDYDKFYAYVAKNKRFDLLQRRLNDKAIQDMWDNKKQVPGIEPFQTSTVSCTKV
jgi:hypothetical protein